MTTQTRHGMELAAEQSGSPVWLRKTLHLRRCLHKQPSTIVELNERDEFGWDVLNCLAWLDINGLAECGPDLVWKLTDRGVESLDWIAIPQGRDPYADLSSLVGALADKYGAKPADILGQAPLGRGVPARDELFHTLRGRGLSIHQLSARFGFKPERVQNAIERFEMRLRRSA